ncbi:hypothetical protein [Pseudomonas entomophila]|uniref:hypothetical protein n=1 Tax=Pseudomonas entomophila TaxID=312306 RepID=UPI00200FCE06|nr:hypothetical protein [Pseudomonas entomophila]
MDNVELVRLLLCVAVVLGGALIIKGLLRLLGITLSKTVEMPLMVGIPAIIAAALSDRWSYPIAVFFDLAK